MPSTVGPCIVTVINLQVPSKQGISCVEKKKNQLDVTECFAALYNMLNVVQHPSSWTYSLLPCT